MEELKLILEAGEGAYNVAVLYFFKEFSQIALTFIGAMITLAIGYKFGVKAFKSYSMAHWSCNTLGIDYPYDESDWRELKKKIEALKESGDL